MERTLSACCRSNGKSLVPNCKTGNKASVVPLAGIEPTAYPLGEGRSILLSYRGMGVKTTTTLSY